MNLQRAIVQSVNRSSTFHSILSIVLFLVILFLIAQPTQAQQEDVYKVQWRDHVFYTDKPMPVMVQTLTIEAYPDTVKGHYFVQFTSLITKEMKEQVVNAGGELFNYVPNNTFIVKMTNEARNRIEALQIIQWVGVYQPAMRVSH